MADYEIVGFIETGLGTSSLCDCHGFQVARMCPVLQLGRHCVKQLCFMLLKSLR